jgi:hypothetical protein
MPKSSTIYVEGVKEGQIMCCAKYKLNGNVLNTRAMKTQQCVCSVLLTFICRLQQTNTYLKVVIETQNSTYLLSRYIWVVAKTMNALRSSYTFSNIFVRF